MLSSISWNQYISMLTVILAGYYIYVGYKYYRWDLLAIVGIKKVEPGTTTLTASQLKQQFTGENHTDYLPKEDPETDLSPVISSFEDEITAYLQGAGKQFTTMKLLDSLKQICLKYPVLNNADSRNELDRFILNTVQRHSADEISIKDIQQIWR
jgi:hypothetical protein